MRRFVIIASLMFILGNIVIYSAFALDSFEPNDIPDEAYGLTNDQQLESWISEASDTDWYVFLSTRLGNLSIALESLPYNYDMDFWWYDPVEEELLLLSRSDNSGTSDEYIGGTLGVAGLFFINVYGINSAYDSQDSYLLYAIWPSNSPEVTVSAPNGSESYSTGSSQTILYTATDSDTPTPLVIKLQYSLDSGSSWTLIDSALTNTGTYNWTVPYQSSSQARVRVSAHDGYSTGYDDSNQDFSISGATHAIAADGNGDYPTIQQAIDAANGGDVIELADGTYTGFRNRDIDFGGKWLTIRSASGDSTACIIDCNGSLSDPHRGFYFHSGESSGIEISGLSIINGYADIGDSYGGGVYCTNSSSPTITSCRFVNNYAQKGGALYSDASGQTVSSCVFSSNSGREGAAVYLLDNNGTVTNCVLKDNVADMSGGALYCRNSSPTLTSCMFADNEANYNGGAILCWITSSPTITSCSFSANSADISGSGLSGWHSSSPVMTRTIIAGATDGQAVHCDATSDATLTCCNVYGNTDGDWIDCLADQVGTADNFSADPMFCNAGADDWEINSSSLCAADNSPTCGLVGVYGVGCGLTGEENVFCVPDTLALTTGAPSGDQAINYTGGGSGTVFGYEIDVEWDHTVVSAVFAKPAAGPFASAAFFTASPIADGHVKVVATIAGGGTGSTGTDDLFKATWTAVAGEDTTAVDLTLIAFRDGDNNSLTGFSEIDGAVTVIVGPQISNVLITNDTMTSTGYIKNGDDATVTAVIEGIGSLLILADLSNLGGGAGATPNTYATMTSTATWDMNSVSTTPADGDLEVIISAWDAAMKPAIPQADTIVADNTKPTGMTGLTAAPGHEKVDLSWSDPASNDTNYGGVTIRAQAWGDYPTYATAAPAYPASETAGVLAYTGGALSAAHTFAPPSRDIYYYRGFVYDLAGNYSVGGDSARSTNYWLGDVVPDGAWNGQVTTADITVLSSQFLLDPLTNTQADVAPTDDASRIGVPVPDGEVDLEDAMIFSLNFGVVSRRRSAPVIELAESEVALTLEISDPGNQEVVIGEVILATVQLHDALSFVKGAQIRVGYDSLAVELLDVMSGELLVANNALVMQQNNRLAAVALGPGLTLGGSGELAVYRFRRIGDNGVNIHLADYQVRDSWNRNVLPGACDVIDDQEPQLPAFLYLLPSRPNPLTESTRIVFGLPTPGPVSLRIFDISGRLVKELVNGHLQPGEYVHKWDRCDSGGKPVGSGVYFYRLKGAGGEKKRKMVVR